jgi:acyl dehydratase
MSATPSNIAEVLEIPFQDIERLQMYTTDIWSGWGPKRIISRADIDTFGFLTDNHQWIHEDDERCRNESVYGEVIAHGLFILTLLPSLLPKEPFLVVGYTHRIVRGGEWRFPAPVYPGDTIHARVRLKKVRLTERGTLLIRETEVWSSGNVERPVVTCTLRLQYF